MPVKSSVVQHERRRTEAEKVKRLKSHTSKKIRISYKPHLEFSPRVELLQALHGLLPVHHGGHSGALLQDKGGYMRPDQNIHTGGPKQSPNTGSRACSSVKYAEV